MKNKLSYIINITIILVFLSVAGSAQENANVETLIKAAESKSVAKENYIKAVKENKPQEEQNRLEMEYLKAVEALSQAKAQLTTAIQPATTPSPIPSPSPTVVPQPIRARTTGDGTTTDTSRPTTTSDNKTIDDCRNRPGLFSTRICTLAENAIDEGKTEGTLNIPLSVNKTLLVEAIYGKLVVKNNITVGDAVKNFVLDAEQRRTDKQVGSDSNSKGTTSLVVKGGVPSFFNFATENGAAVRSISGTTVTFRFNPVGIFQALNDYSATNILNDFRSESSSTKKTTDASKFLRKLSVGLSFDASRGQETPVLVGNERQLSAFSLRYEFLNDRNPRKAKWRQKWNEFFAANNPSFVKGIAQAQGIIFDDKTKFKNEKLKKWFDNMNVELGKLPITSSVAVVEQVINEQFELLPASLAGDQDLQAFEKITNLIVEYREKRQELLDEIAKAPVISFEYTNNREPDLPDTHNFNFIFAKGIGLGKGYVMDTTFNASLTFFNRKPVSADVKRIRDFSFAGQLDLPLYNSKEEHTNDAFYGTVFSLAGKYQRLTGDATALDGTVIPNLKGDIWIGQAKLNIPFNFSFFKDKGISFPISVTFANRTELVRESRVRGNFGFTFDIDKFILSNVLDRFR